MQSEVHQIPVKIAYVGGGSTNWAVKLMADLAAEARLSAEVRLFDIDVNAAQRNADIGAKFAKVSKGPATRYRVADSLEDALADVDFVVISILPGSLDDMANDIEIPAKFGINQSVGDTVGPGGFVRALRAIPMIADIGKAIKNCAPSAFVCNLTNPMSVLTGVLYSVFPEIKAWGECHEVTKLRKIIAEIASPDGGSSAVSFRDVNVNVLGINHFTFVDQIAVGGVDMMPKYRDFVQSHLKDGWFEGAGSSDPEHQRYFGSKNLVCFDLLQRFGVAAAAGDRHLAEFFPQSDYLTNPEKWGFALTPVAYRKKERSAKLKKLSKAANGEAALFAQKSDEALTDQIVGLLSRQSFISNVNLPNQGQFAGLPNGTIVETNAVFSGTGIKPLLSGTLPDELMHIVRDHAARQMELLDAVMASDPAPLFGLFETDPLVNSLPRARARKLFREMVSATSHLLPKEIVRAA